MVTFLHVHVLKFSLFSDKKLEENNIDNIARMAYNSLFELNSNIGTCSFNVCLFLKGHAF